MAALGVQPHVELLARADPEPGEEALGEHAQQALVLSGGSARGLAHVGVLLELEALGYDPDIVVGTSMGAVVGALYAAGHSPEEIRDRILAIAWGGMFDPTAVARGPDRELRLPIASFARPSRRSTAKNRC